MKRFLVQVARSVRENAASVCVRPDLIVETIQRGVQTVYVVKDPLRLKFFELDEHEFALLDRLTEDCDHGELLEWFNRRFPPLHLTSIALQQMIWQLYQQGLVVSTRAGHGQRQAAQETQARRGDLWRRFRNPWAIRLPGINPQPWLPVANWLMGWLFNRWFVSAAIPLLFLLGGFAFARQRDFWAMSPQLAEFLSKGNLLLLAVAVVVVKLLHELGHAIAAYRQGCACHELGVLLLAGMPTLYCDVSDAWTLPHRWSRLCVSIAGIWMELLIAAMAFVLWSTSVPGLVHAICFNLMVVCSVGTVMFNANPLVRYDGYFVLMDLTGVSNLGHRSRQLCQRYFDRLLFGSRFTPALDQAELPAWVPWYGLLSIGYGIFLTAAVLWGLHLAAKPYAATAALWTVASLGFAAWGANMIRSTIHRTRQAVRSGTPTWRLAAGWLGLCGAVALLGLAPLPRFIIGVAILEPAGHQPVVTTVAGLPLALISDGSAVEAGSRVVELQNSEMQRQFQQLEHELSAQCQRVQSLSSRRNEDRRAAEQLPEARATLVAWEQQLDYLREEIQRLDIQAPNAGRIYSAPLRPERPDADELPRWTGSLLDAANRQAWMEAGDEIAHVGDARQFEAVAILPQDEMEAVAVGQTADVLLLASRRTIRGEVVAISRAKVEQAADQSDPDSIDNPFSRRQATNKNWYQVQVRCLEPCPEELRIRSRGKVRIHVGTRTVGSWLVHQFCRIFRWLA